MLIKYKSLSLSLLMIGFTLLVSCKKNDDDLKRQIAELTARVTSIENQLTQINNNITTLQQQGKLNADEVTSLKSLTANLSVITNDIKDNTSLNTKDIETLKTSVQQAATTVQFNDLKQTISQLNDLVAGNYLEQQLNTQNTAKLNAIITQLSADLEKLKNGPAGATTDRPVNVRASKGTFGNLIVISWTPLPTAKNYQLFKFNSSSGQYDMIKQGPDTTYTDVSFFEAYKKEFYKVKVVNSSSDFSDFSDVDYGYASGLNFNLYFSFGSPGTGAGQFNTPAHIAVDANNNIYVSNSNDVMGNVQKFDRAGNYQELFFTGSGARAIAFLKNGNAVVTKTQGSSSIQILDAQKNVIRAWGSQGGTGDTQFGNIEEITVDDEDNIYVVDGLNNYIKKFDQNGNFLLKFKAAVKVGPQIETEYPFGICFYNNKLFVTSPRNGQIRIYDKQGNFIKSWDTGSKCNGIKAFKNHLYIACSTFVLKTDEEGEVRQNIGEGKFSNIITGLAVNSDEEIIVSDQSIQSIKVFKELK